jgi:hypothetical protein
MINRSGRYAAPCRFQVLYWLLALFIVMLSAMVPVAALKPETRRDNSVAAQTIPEQRNSELLIASAVFFCVCLYLWPLRDFVAFNADEGIVLADADRVLRGQVPYRDFFSLYTPGSYLFLALAFKVFGQSLIVARNLLLVYCGIFSSITYLLARRISSRTASLFATAVLAFGCLPFRFLVLHNWDSTLYAMLALYSAARLMETGSRFWASVLGLKAALTCLTEQARGAGLLLGLAIACAVVLPRLRVKPIRSVYWAAAGFLIPFAATFAYFASHQAVMAMLRSWLWPLRGYYADNHVAYGFVSVGAPLEFFCNAQGKLQPFVVLFGAPMFLISALPIMVVISIAYWLMRYLRSRDVTPDLRVLGGCAFLGIWLSTLATSRADLSHMLYITPLFAYLLPSILDINDRWGRSLYALRPLLAALLLISFAGFGLSARMKAAGPTKHLQTSRGEIRTPYDDQVIPYIQAHLAKGEHLFVHPYQPLYSFLTGTVSASRFDGILRPTPEASSMVIAEMSRGTIPFVLLERTFAEKAAVVWPAIPLGALASDPIEDYILRNYHTCKVLNLNQPQAWVFDFMAHKGLACPPEGHDLQ